EMLSALVQHLFPTFVRHTCHDVRPTPHNAHSGPKKPVTLVWTPDARSRGGPGGANPRRAPGLSGRGAPEAPLRMMALFLGIMLQRRRRAWPRGLIEILR